MASNSFYFSPSFRTLPTVFSLLSPFFFSSFPHFIFLQPEKKASSPNPLFITQSPYPIGNPSWSCGARPQTDEAQGRVFLVRGDTLTEFPHRHNTEKKKKKKELFSFLYFDWLLAHEIIYTASAAFDFCCNRKYL